MRAGDIITRIGEREVGNPEDFEQGLAAMKEARSVRISVYRNGKWNEVRLSSRP
jgi:S1-C subfamily serine protease